MLKPKMHQIRFRLRPRTSLGELTALSQTPELDLRGPTSKGEGEGSKGRGRKGKKEGRKWMRREVDGRGST